MQIEKARPEDAETLTRIAIAAKRQWGYPESWIDQWRELLTITPEYASIHPTFIAVAGDQILGFCVLDIRDSKASLEHLWVLPDAMLRGIGRLLFQHCEAVAIAAGASRLDISSDPNATGFYLSMGASIVGETPAPMDGKDRFLPLLEKNLK